MKILHGVAVFAAIIVRRASELTIVHVFMTVDTVGEFHLVNRVFASGQMALVALHLDVLAFERISRCNVLLDPEERWLPPFYRVAFRALTLLGTRLKLALVGVFVTVHAVGKRKRFFEIAIGVARGAADGGMLSHQRILRFGMVKIESRQKFFPSRGGVTFFAALLE